MWLKYEIRPAALCVEWASASGTILGDLGDRLEEVSPGDCAVKAYAWSPVAPRVLQPVSLERSSL